MATSLPRIQGEGGTLLGSLAEQLKATVLNQKYISDELRKRSLELDTTLKDFVLSRDGNVSDEFLTISEHLVDRLKDSSRNSELERANELSLMSYLKKSIKEKVTDREEQEKLLAAYEEATAAIKKHTSAFTKTEHFLIRQIGTLAGTFASLIPDVPPIVSVLATQGGNLIGKTLEKRKIRTEREALLSEEIRSRNDTTTRNIERTETQRRPPVLGEHPGFQQNAPTETTGVERLSSLGDSLSVRIEPQRASPLGRAVAAGTTRAGFGRVLADGSKRRPFFVKSLDKKEKEEGLLGKLFGLIMGSALFKGLAALVGGFGALLTGKGLAATLGEKLAAAITAKAVGRSPSVSVDLPDRQTPIPQPPSTTTQQPPKKGIFSSLKEGFSKVKETAVSGFEKGKSFVTGGITGIKETAKSGLSRAGNAISSGATAIRDFGAGTFEKLRGGLSSGITNARSLVDSGIEKGKSVFQKAGKVIKAVPWEKVVSKAGVKTTLKLAGGAVAAVAAPLSAGASTLISGALWADAAKDIYDIYSEINKALSKESESSLSSAENYTEDLKRNVLGEKGEKFSPQTTTPKFELEQPTKIEGSTLSKYDYKEKAGILTTSTSNVSTNNTVINNAPTNVTNVTNVSGNNRPQTAPIIIMDNPNAGIAAGYWSR